VNKPHLTALVEEYRVGLEAELVLLGRLQSIAARQHQTTQATDIEALQRAADERDALMSGLMAIEQDVRRIREELGRSKAAVRRLPGFDHVAGLHETASRIVKEVLTTDRDSIRALEQIVASRRMAAQALEQAESTLAAYSRLTTPPPAATLVNRRG
jgi:uncharacterized protein YhaN